MSEKTPMTVKVPTGLLLKAKAYAVLFDMTLEAVVEDALAEWTNDRISQARRELARLRKGKIDA